MRVRTTNQSDSGLTCRNGNRKQGYNKLDIRLPYQKTEADTSQHSSALFNRFISSTCFFPRKINQCLFLYWNISVYLPCSKRNHPSFSTPSTDIHSKRRAPKLELSRSPTTCARGQSPPYCGPHCGSRVLKRPRRPHHPPAWRSRWRNQKSWRARWKSVFKELQNQKIQLTKFQLYQLYAFCFRWFDVGKTHFFVSLVLCFPPELWISASSIRR